jgi:hypothetical protein
MTERTKFLHARRHGVVKAEGHSEIEPRRRIYDSRGTRERWSNLAKLWMKLLNHFDGVAADALA